jgi:hypothetical protein
LEWGDGDCRFLIRLETRPERGFVLVISAFGAWFRLAEEEVGARLSPTGGCVRGDDDCRFLIVGSTRPERGFVLVISAFGGWFRLAVEEVGARLLRSR